MMMVHASTTSPPMFHPRHIFRSISFRQLVGWLILTLGSPQARAEGDWEVTVASEKALQSGLDWMGITQGAEGNWTSNDVGLVSMGALAFMAAGHAPGRGKHGQVIDRALNYVVTNAR